MTWGWTQVVANKVKSPFRKETISLPPSLDSPYTRSTNEMGTCWNKQHCLWVQKQNWEQKKDLWAGACWGRGRRKHQASPRVPALSRAFNAAQGLGSVEWLALSPLKLIQRHYSWLDDPPRHSKLTAPKACSISLSARLRALQSVPQEAQICPQEQLSLTLPGRWLQNMTVPVVQDLLLPLFAHF